MINEVVDVFKGRFLEVGIEVKSYAEVTQGLQKVCNVDERNQILLLDTGDTLDAARLDHILKKADRDPQRSAQLRIFLFDKTCMEEKPDKIFQSRIVRKVPSFTLSDFPKLVPLYETHSNSSIIERAAWYFNTEKESLGILMDSKKKYEDVRNAFIQSKELLYSFQNFSSGTKVTVDNLMLHYIVSYRKVEKFNYHYKSYLQKYEEVLTSFDSDVENLREFDIDGSLADRKISDFIDFDKLYQWRGNCEDSHKKIDSRVKLIYQTLEDIKRRVEAQEESAKTEIPPEFEKAVTVIENLLEKELRSSLQTVFNSYINIRKNLEKCIRSNFATEDVNSLKAAKEELDGNSYSRYVMTASDVTDKVTNWKIKMEKLNKWAIKELFEVLRNVGSLETDIKFKVKKKTDFMMDILTQQSKSLRYVQLPRMFPVAYKNAVQEMERRRGFKTEFEKILRHMHELCKTESEKRAKFLTSFGDFIPQDFCPELKEPPPALSVQNCQFSADHELITENVSLKKKLADLDAKYQDLIKTKEEYDVTNQKLHNDYQNKFNQWKTDFENKLLTVSTYGDDKRSDTGESSPTKLTDQNSNSPNNDLRFISTFGSNSIDVKNQQQQEMDRLREVEQLAREEVYEMERRKDEMLSKLDSLKEGVREIERDHDKHESCREQWQERTTRIAEEVSRLEKETTRFQGDRDVLAGSLATLREEIKSMEQEESDLKKRSLRIEDLKKLEREELVTEKTLVEKLDDLKVHSKILNDDYENLCIQIGNIDHEKVAKETALKEMQDQASSLEIKRSKCELEIKEMGEFIKSLMQVKEETGKRIEDLQEGMSEAEVIASTIIKVHQEEMKTLREENDQGRIRCMELEEKCALLESAQKGEKQPFELEIKAKEEEVDVLKTRLRSLEDYYSPQLQTCLEACITEIVESQKMIENSAQRFNITLKFKPWREDLEEIVKNISERVGKLKVQPMLEQLLTATLLDQHDTKKILHDKAETEARILQGATVTLQAMGIEIVEEMTIEDRFNLLNERASKMSKDLEKYKNLSRRLHERLDTRVAVREVEKGDLALFFVTRANSYIAYNVEKRVYFLHPSVSRECANRQAVLGKVKDITASKATESNCQDFGLEPGDELLLVHAEILHSSQRQPKEKKRGRAVA